MIDFNCTVVTLETKLTTKIHPNVSQNAGRNISDHSHSSTLTHSSLHKMAENVCPFVIIVYTLQLTISPPVPPISLLEGSETFL